LKAITYSFARQHLAGTMDKVCRDKDPVIITRKASESVVMMSLEDYEALEETAYLLRSPENAKRLMEFLNQLETGKGLIRDLAE